MLASCCGHLVEISAASFNSRSFNFISYNTIPQCFHFSVSHDCSFCMCIHMSKNISTNIPSIFNSVLSLFNLYLARFLATLFIFCLVWKKHYSHAFSHLRCILYSKSNIIGSDCNCGTLCCIVCSLLSCRNKISSTVPKCFSSDI